MTAVVRAMLVSVCVPTYQGEPHLAQTLTSALAQEGVDLEVVVVDNASSDRTSELLAEVDDPRVRVLRNPHTVDLPTNFRRAVEATTGEVVKVLCDDDLLLPGALASQAAVLAQLPHVRLVASRRAFIDDDGRVLSGGSGLRGMRGEIPGRAVALRYARTGINPVGEPANTMFRRADYDAVGGWPTTPDQTFTSDLELWLRLLEGGYLFAQGEALAAFRIAHDGLSQTAETRNQEANARFARSVAGDPRWRMSPWDRACAAVVPSLTWQLWRWRQTGMRASGGLGSALGSARSAVRGR